MPDAIASRRVFGSRDSVQGRGALTMRSLFVEAARSPVIDLAVLSSQTGGDMLLEREVLALFAVRAKADIALLGTAGADLRREVAHRMVGAARAVGASAVAAEARAVENGASSLEALGAAVDAACQFVADHLARAG